MRRHYFVVRDQEEWKVYLDGDYSDANCDQKAVIAAAVDAAYKSGREGYQAIVFVPDENHQFRVTWTYGKDTYPPIN
ncbi:MULTISPECIES: DUF2188 domain-containing protein [unclassified Sinorhizobium]|uniref:DUF2188 domain-containing protein n=1 Tax=unclassified Sinorhizobium TaxID=2613772 RepID=UPI0035236B55